MRSLLSRLGIEKRTNALPSSSRGSEMTLSSKLEELLRQAIELEKQVHYRLPVRLGYDELAAILDDALAQAQSGKGHDRHASGEPWIEQTIFQIPRSLEEVGAGFNAGQYAKKMHEAMRLPHAKRREEFLGAIVYAASLVRLYDRLYVDQTR